MTIFDSRGRITNSVIKEAPSTNGTHRNVRIADLERMGISTGIRMLGSYLTRDKFEFLPDGLIQDMWWGRLVELSLEHYNHRQSLGTESRFYSLREHRSWRNRRSTHWTIDMIEIDWPEETKLAEMQAKANLPQAWERSLGMKHVVDAKMLRSKPTRGKAHLSGTHSLARVIINGIERVMLLDGGAVCSVVGTSYLNEIMPEWRTKLLPCFSLQFKSCGGSLKPLGVIELSAIFPHTLGSVRIQAEFVVMENAHPRYLILGTNYLNLYGFDIRHSKEHFFTIGGEKLKKKFLFIDPKASRRKRLVESIEEDRDSREV